jgi:hypothetical protein
MSAHDEKQRRRKTCFFIDECGVRLQLPKLPVMTAQCFFHKFFARESFRRHDRFVVAQACLFLAAKVEESAVSLRSLVRECHGVRYAGKSRAPLDESSERDVKRSVVMAERAVLYARRGVSFRPSLLAFRSAPRRRPQWPRALFGNERCVGRVDGVGGAAPACRWRRRGGRAPRERRREGGEIHTHNERIQQDARRPRSI